MKSDILLDFTKTTYSLINSGLTLNEALEICSIADKKLSTFSNYLRGKLLDGERFYIALLECKIIKVPSFYSSMIKIGEESGSVKEVFNALSYYLEKQKFIKQKVIQAILYPAFICFLTLFLSIFVCIFVFPKINDILESFSSMSIEIASKMENLFVSLKVFAIIVIVLFLFMMFLLIGRRKNESIKEFEDSILLKVPVVGNLIITYCCRDFCFAMKLLCSSGIPVAKALSECENIVSNKKYSKEIMLLGEHIKNGESFSEFTKTSPIFPSKMKMWFTIGEQTGNINEIFNELYSFYEKETENNVTIATNALEPLFIVITGIILMIFVINFVMPIFNILGGI